MAMGLWDSLVDYGRSRCFDAVILQKKEVAIETLRIECALFFGSNKEASRVELSLTALSIMDVQLP